MADRETIREQLSAYLDGELADEQRRAVQQAVEADEELARELAELEATRKLVRGLPRHRADDEFVSRVLARAERADLLNAAGQASAPPRLGWVRWLAAAAVVLIAVGIGVVLTQFLQSPGFDPTNGKPAELAIADPQPAADEMYVARRSAEAEAPEVLASRRMTPPAAAADRPTGTMGRPESFGVAMADDETRLDEFQPDMPAEGIHSQPGAAIALGPKGLPLDSDPDVAGQTLAAAPAEDEVAAEPQPLAERVAEASPAGVGGAMAVVAAPVPPPVLPAELADARQAVLVTEDLSGTQRQIEAAMMRNSVEPLVLTEEMPTAARQIELQQASLMANYSQLPATPANQVQYVAYVTPSQMSGVLADLANIREAQVVPAGDSYVAIVRTPEGSLRLKKPGEPEPVAPPPSRARRLPYRRRGESMRRVATAPQPDDVAEVKKEETASAATIEPLVITLNYRLPAAPTTQATQPAGME